MEQTYMLRFLFNFFFNFILPRKISYKKSWRLLEARLHVGNPRRAYKKITIGKISCVFLVILGKQTLRFFSFRTLLGISIFILK